MEEGDHEIKIYVGACVNHVGVDNTNRVITGGFDTPSRLHIEEVRMYQAVDAGKINKLLLFYF